jgi:type IV pilus assembly protein PilB
MKENQFLGKLLVLKNIITEDTLNAARIRLDKSDSKRSLEEVLVEDFNVDRDKLYTEVAKLYAITKVNINPEKLTESEIDEITQLLDALPKEIKSEATQKRIIPYKVQKKRIETLIILAANPTDSFAKDIASYSKVKRYEIVYCPYEEVTRLLDLVQKEDNEYLKILDADEKTIDINVIEESRTDDQELIDQEINKGALVYLFEAALVEAVKTKVSDIHIIPFDNRTTDIYFRIDGKLQLWKRKENINPMAFQAVVKDRSQEVDRFKIDEAQDGFIQREVDNYTIRYRVSILPIVAKQAEKHFESIVIRILDDRNVIDNIDDLGFLPQARADFEKAVAKPQGLIIITGPTGSGKSTTLLAALYHVITSEKNALTVEQPVEYIVKGARQIKISQKLDFENALRAILRHDPDIVMVGEIRDKQTAEIGIKLANTGHLTFSTLHTNDAPSAISRLYKMNIETFLMANAINIIVAQRLVRRLCPKCKQPVSPDKAPLYEPYGITAEELAAGQICEPVGCDYCRGTGFKGRLGIHEALYFSRELQDVILQAHTDIDENAIREVARSKGMLSLRESGLALVMKGTASLDDVLATTSISD